MGAIITVMLLNELFDIISGSNENIIRVRMKYRSPALTSQYDNPFEEEFRQFRQKNPNLKGGELLAAFRKKTIGTKKYAELVKSRSTQK